MVRLIFDVETNGLLPELDTIHSLVIKDADTGEVWSCHDHGGPGGIPISWGLQILSEADVLIGHNILKFDIPAIKKVYHNWTYKGKVRDTLVIARLMWPDIAIKDKLLAARGRIPGNMVGRYSLESFGYRLRRWKGDYAADMKAAGLDPWFSWNVKMQEYCEQDVEVTDGLWALIQKRWVAFSDRSVDLEHAVAAILIRQEERGFAFDERGCVELYTDLIEHREKLDDKLRETLKGWEIRTPFVPKANNKKYGYVKGVPTEKVKWIEFNPGSRHHIAKVLIDDYGWEPEEYNKDGSVKIDDEILGKLPWPKAQMIAEFLMVKKRISQVADGGQAWLKKVKDGRIHGVVNHNGAVTGRMTHSSPNMSQVPTSHAPYGHRCRSLFHAGEGFALLGVDADALELCCLAGYMARYDGGAYIHTVLRGDKKAGTDIHSVNARALGLDPEKRYQIGGQTPTGRDIAKVWFYAFIYGAGNLKLARILGENDAKVGAKSRSAFLKALPALGKLIEDVRAKAKQFGALRGLDGRRLYTRSLHTALNTLLQSAGAIIMKEALVTFDTELQENGFVPGVDYEFVANSHDEWQLECLPEWADKFGRVAVASMAKAGLSLDFPCPISGSYSKGHTWAETH